jgi:adenylate cyclase
MAEPGASLRFTDLAEWLLEHRLAQRDLAARPEGTKLREAFRALARVFALEHAVAAGEPPREILSIIADGLIEAVQAARGRVVLRSAQGELFVACATSDDPLAGDILATQTAPVVAGGEPLVLDIAAGERRLNLACVPLRRADGEIVGVLQLFDKGDTPFDAVDLALAVLAGTTLAELAVTAGLLPWLSEGTRLVPLSSAALESGDASGRELILTRILAVALDILSADRGWIFLYDPITDELYTTLSQGIGTQQLRIGVNDGIAGATFRTGELVNVAQAYQDPRFNPAIDRRFGYRTRNILCAPIFSAEGQRLGVLQLVNKRRGAFDVADENHLKSLAAQIGVTLDYTVLFEQVLRMKSHNESMLRSLTNGVLTIDMRGEVTFANQAVLAFLRRNEADTLGSPLMRIFGEMNAWILEAIDEVANGRAEKQLPNSEFYIESAGEWVSANLAILPLLDAGRTTLGFMLVIENLERERELRRTMSRYLSNEVIDRLIQDSGEALGGTAQVATTLFSDIRGFTALSESLGPAGTVSMLNEYFSYMEDVLSNRSGIIDKYVGDAVMAVFGLPFPSEADAPNAVQAACDMMQVLGLLNQRRAASSAGLIRIGVGIATGNVIAGNIGSPKRMDFTVIGDPVNLASRIEGLTKLYGADILICEATRSRLTTPLKQRRLDVVRVRGQHRATILTEVLEHRAAEGGAALDGAIAAYESGLAAYLAGDWSGALGRFETALRLRPEDAAAALMIERCRRFAAEPPTGWDGISLSVG